MHSYFGASFLLMFFPFFQVSVPVVQAFHSLLLLKISSVGLDRFIGVSLLFCFSFFLLYPLVVLGKNNVPKQHLQQKLNKPALKRSRISLGH